MPDRRFYRRTWGTLGILVALVSFAAPREADARTWTDAKGNKISATYERVQDDEVVLKRGFDIIRVPLAKLSVDDREYVQQKLKEAGNRIWSDLKGRQIVARPLRIKDGNLELKSKGQTIAVPFGQLTFEDQEYVREWLSGRGESTLMPKPDEDSRVWTDETGRKVMARLESVERGRALRLRSYGVDIPIAYDKLSAADKDHLRKKLTAEGKADLLFPPPVQVAVASPPPAAPVPRPAAPLRPNVSPVPSPPPPPPRAEPQFSLPQTTEMRIEEYRICLECNKKLPPGAQFCQACVDRAKKKAFGGSGEFNTAYGAGRISGYCVLIGLVCSVIGFLYRTFGDG